MTSRAAPARIARRVRRGTAIAAGILVVVTSLHACAADAPPPCSTVAPPCDALEPSCQQALLDALACLKSEGRGGSDASVERWSSEKAQQAATDSVTMLTQEQQVLLRRQAAALSLFRLAPEGWDPVQAAANYIATVSAFYDPSTGSIVVVQPETPPEPAPDAGAAGAGLATGADDTSAEPDEAWTRTMAHELTHMLRDAESGIGRLFAEHGTTFDRLLALRGILEGEAELYAELAVLEQRGTPFDASALSQVIEQRKRDTLIAFEQVDAPFALADRYLLYPYGFGYVLAAYQQGGPRGVDALFEAPPESTRRLTSGFGAVEPFGGVWSEDVDLAGTTAALPEGYESVGVSNLGVWLIDGFVQRVKPAPTHDLSWAVLSALRADALTLVHDRERDAPAAIWRMRFADEPAALAMAALTPWPDALTVRVEGRDVIFTASASPEARAALGAVTFRIIVASAPAPASSLTAEALLHPGVQPLPWLLANLPSTE